VVPPSLRVDPAQDTLPSREEFVNAMLGQFGMTAEHWNSEYDKLEKR
jgi:hypothetical protein